LSPLGRLAFVGNSLPRRCGIATFTTDLQQAMEQLRPNEPSCIVAMTDPDHAYDYPPAVRLHINDRNLEEYEHAAYVLNMAGCEVVSLQHEFGIFGGGRSHPRAYLTADHAARHDAPHGTVAANISAAPRSRRDSRDFLARHCHGGKGQGTAAQRVSSAGRKNRGH
jgi:hypothetical protein